MSFANLLVHWEVVGYVCQQKTAQIFASRLMPAKSLLHRKHNVMIYGHWRLVNLFVDFSVPRVGKKLST